MTTLKTQSINRWLEKKRNDKKKVNGISFISVQLSSKLPQQDFNEYGVRIIKSSNLMKFKKRKKSFYFQHAWIARNNWTRTHLIVPVQAYILEVREGLVMVTCALL